MDSWGDDGLEGLPQATAEAAAALEALEAPAEKAASAIEAAFSRAGAGLAGSLARAAADGKVTLDELAEAALRAFELLMRAPSGKGGSLADALSSAVSAAFSGARADGGPVGAGGAYLVGERGPEVFRPASAGVVEPASGGGVTVNVTVQGEGRETLLRSEAQIAQALARAALLGARRL